MCGIELQNVNLLGRQFGGELGEYDGQNPIFHGIRPDPLVNINLGSRYMNFGLP